MGQNSKTQIMILVSLCIMLSLSACSTIRDFLEQSQNNPQATATFSPSPIPLTPTDSNLPNTNNQSGGMTAEDASLLPPLQPVNVNAAAVGDAVEIQWQGTGLDIGLHYKLYRRIAGTEVWQNIAIIPVEGNNQGSYSYQDTTIAANTAYEYALTIVDSFSNESNFSPIMAVNSN